MARDREPGFGSILARAKGGTESAAAAKKTAKREDPDFCQRSYFIRRSTEARMKEKLRQMNAAANEDGQMDMSDLIEAVCREWLGD